MSARTSSTIGALAKALAAAQGEIENAAKNAENPHFKSRYADLAALLDAARPVLSRNRLAVAQFSTFASHGDRGGGMVSLETILMHESGEWMAETASAQIAKTDPQSIGAAVTYLRRYSLAAVAGIAQADDDGEAASAAPRTNPLAKQAGSAPPVDPRTTLATACRDAKPDDAEYPARIAKWASRARTSSINDLTNSEAVEAINSLNAAKAKEATK